MLAWEPEGSRGLSLRSKSIWASEIGSQIPLHAGAAGKTIPARLPAAGDVMNLEAFTDRTITNPATLKDELDEVRARGWAVGWGEK